MCLREIWGKLSDLFGPASPVAKREIGNDLGLRDSANANQVRQIKAIAIDKSLINTSAPFPQADSFERVLIMLSQIANNHLDKAQLRSRHDIDKRQVEYYYNALVWLGLCGIDGERIALTNRGRIISQLSEKDKLWELARIVFSDTIFHTALHLGLDKIPESEFVKWRIDPDKGTAQRRKQTIKAWIDYFITKSEP